MKEVKVMEKVNRCCESILREIARRIGADGEESGPLRALPWETLHAVHVEGVDEPGLLRVRSPLACREAEDAVLAEHLLARRLEEQWSELLGAEVRVQPVLGGHPLGAGQRRVRAKAGSTEVLFCHGPALAACFPAALPAPGDRSEGELVLHAGEPLPGTMRLAPFGGELWSLRVGERVMPVVLSTDGDGGIHVGPSGGERGRPTLSIPVRLRGVEAGAVIEAIRAWGTSADEARRRISWQRVDEGLVVSVDRGVPSTSVPVEEGPLSLPHRRADRFSASDRETIVRQYQPRY